MMLSDKLKELRDQAKQPQRKVAAALDIDTATYSKIENGKYMPNRDFVLRWLRSLNVTANSSSSCGLQTEWWKW